MNRLIPSIVVIMVVVSAIMTGCAEETTPFVLVSPTETPTLIASPTQSTLDESGFFVAGGTPTSTPTELPTATSTPIVTTPAVTVTTGTRDGVAQKDLSLEPADISLFPASDIEVGDSVTIRLLPSIPAGLDVRRVDARIHIDGVEIGADILRENINFGGDNGIIFEWAWTAEASGFYTLTAELDTNNTIYEGDENPDNNRVEMMLGVNEPETSARGRSTWQTVSTAYVNIHYVTGTAAERDIDRLRARVDDAVQNAAKSLHITPETGSDNRLDIYFVDRIFGQGGYTGSASVISYPDRNYAGGELDALLTHEVIHIFDNRATQGTKYIFLREGLAVWGTGGHYKQENLDQRASALLIDTDLYIPLHDLVDNFYPTQHEIGYLEAGAFVSYLVYTYGWEQFSQFYNTLPEPKPGDSIAETLSLATATSFGKTLRQLEKDWQAHLQAQPPSQSAADLEMSIYFYEVMRAYQQKHDPTAYFLSAWLPAAQTAHRMEQTSVMTRRPRDHVNIVYETMLVSADQALNDGNFSRVQTLLESVQRSLDSGIFNDPISSHYESIVHLTLAKGYEPQRIQIDGSSAKVLATATDWGDLITLNLTEKKRKWRLSQ